MSPYDTVGKSSATHISFIDYRLSGQKNSTAQLRKVQNVPPSRVAAGDDRAWVLVKRTFPSKTNVSVGRWLAGKKNSFQQKRLTEMVRPPQTPADFHFLLLISSRTFDQGRARHGHCRIDY
eukprot:1191192-Prorocentrum_minimum.AAC.2